MLLAHRRSYRCVNGGLFEVKEQMNVHLQKNSPSLRAQPVLSARFSACAVAHASALQLQMRTMREIRVPLYFLFLKFWARPPLTWSYS